MRKIALFFVIGIVLLVGFVFFSHKSSKLLAPEVKNAYWFMLERKANVETLYKGTPGDVNNSEVVRVFQVKTGIAGKSPTPLPALMGREYWKIIKKESSAENIDTAPYFLTLDVPSGPDWPYGPTPYEECTNEEGKKVQCDWGYPGYFGLHGTNGDKSKLGNENKGSLGCIRHTDEDITYLYDLLDPEREEIRYYIQDI